MLQAPPTERPPKERSARPTASWLNSGTLIPMMEKTKLKPRRCFMTLQQLKRSSLTQVTSDTTHTCHLSIVHLLLSEFREKFDNGEDPLDHEAQNQNPWGQHGGSPFGHGQGFTFKFKWQ